MRCGGAGGEGEIMIYVDIPLDKWVARHSLIIRDVVCKKCGANLQTTVPCVSNGCAGLVTPLCCGENHASIVMVPYTSKMKDFWARIFG